MLGAVGGFWSMGPVRGDVDVLTIPRPEVEKSRGGRVGVNRAG